MARCMILIIQNVHSANSITMGKSTNWDLEVYGMEYNTFPFTDEPNTDCFTCCHVLQDNKPILYVSHDKDGYCQFLCGKTHKEEEARIVSLATILSIDETVSNLAKLDYGECAELENETTDWIVRYINKILNLS